MLGIQQRAVMWANDRAVAVLASLIPLPEPDAMEEYELTKPVSLKDLLNVIREDASKMGFEENIKDFDDDELIEWLVDDEEELEWFDGDDDMEDIEDT